VSLYSHVTTVTCILRGEFSGVRQEAVVEGAIRPIDHLATDFCIRIRRRIEYEFSSMFIWSLRMEMTRIWCIIPSVEHNYISLSITVGIKLHVSALYVGHLQVTI